MKFLNGIICIILFSDVAFWYWVSSLFSDLNMSLSSSHHHHHHVISIPSSRPSCYQHLTITTIMVASCYHRAVIMSSSCHHHAIIVLSLCRHHVIIVLSSFKAVFRMVILKKSVFSQERDLWTSKYHFWEIKFWQSNDYLQWWNFEK